MNGNIIKAITPNSLSIIAFSMTFNVPSSANKTAYNFSMEGAGTLDGLGLTIDNVKLYKQGTTANLIQNGDFESPQTPSWNIFTNKDNIAIKWSVNPEI